MSKVQTLRVFVNQRLTAAAEEIFELFERTIAEYEEQLCRQNKLLDAGSRPLLVSQEVDPRKQQEWSTSLDQEDPPQLPHIKEEQEELWTSQEEEQLHGPEEADIIKSTFTPVPVKSEEDDEEKPQSSQLHQTQTEEMKAEADGEDCGGPEPTRDLNPDSHLLADTDDKMSDCSEPDSDDSWVWEDTREPQSGSNSLQNNEVPVSEVECKKSFSCPFCDKSFPQKRPLMIHKRIHADEKHFTCSFCNKAFKRNRDVERHMRVHTGEKPFSCSVCGKRFKQSCAMTYHSRIHTGEKPFVCSVCKASFCDKSSLTRHMRVHTGEKPFSCVVCGKRFARKGHLRRHMTVHTRTKTIRLQQM